MGYEKSVGNVDWRKNHTDHNKKCVFTLNVLKFLIFFLIALFRKSFKKILSLDFGEKLQRLEKMLPTIIKNFPTSKEQQPISKYC